jgi:hypothetical protein
MLFHFPRPLKVDICCPGAVIHYKAVIRHYFVDEPSMINTLNSQENTKRGEGYAALLRVELQ